MELVAGSGELDKTWFREALLEQELGGLRYSEQIRLVGSLANPCISTDCLVDRLPLGGGFLPSSLISSFITRRRVIFMFASFFPTLLHSILLLCCYDYRLEQFVCLSARIYTISHLVLSQCKINRVVTLIWGSKQLSCFQHIFELLGNNKKQQRIQKDFSSSIKLP